MLRKQLKTEGGAIDQGAASKKLAEEWKLTGAKNAKKSKKNSNRRMRGRPSPRNGEIQLAKGLGRQRGGVLISGTENRVRWEKKPVIPEWVEGGKGRKIAKRGRRAMTEEQSHLRGKPGGKKTRT